MLLWADFEAVSIRGLIEVLVRQISAEGPPRMLRAPSNQRPSMERERVADRPRALARFGLYGRRSQPSSAEGDSIVSSPRRMTAICAELPAKPT